MSVAMKEPNSGVRPVTTPPSVALRRMPVQRTLAARATSPVRVFVADLAKTPKGIDAAAEGRWSYSIAQRSLRDGLEVIVGDTRLRSSFDGSAHTQMHESANRICHERGSASAFRFCTAKGSLRRRVTLGGICFARFLPCEVEIIHFASNSRTIAPRRAGLSPPHWFALVQFAELGSCDNAARNSSRRNAAPVVLVSDRARREPRAGNGS